MDKHSTGGVGDKVSMVVGPLIASLGVPFAKMAGRGLGFTGGTIDKLESIEGFQTSMTTDAFIEQVNQHGIAIMAQTVELAPADKKLYALRDVTATVNDMSLIASSIMSKKLAAGADVIVLDVKTGSGAFMKKEEDAHMLAQEMVKIGKGAHRKVTAVITDMDQPLGTAVGNALEVIEAIEALKGHGNEDFLQVCLTLGAYILTGAGKADTIEQAQNLLKGAIADGSALNKMREWIVCQGGNPAVLEDYSLFGQAAVRLELQAPHNGYVSHIQCEEVGRTAMILGGGRSCQTDIIDSTVGIVLHKKVGAKVDAGDCIATIYANDEQKCKEAQQQLLAAYTFTQEPPALRPIVHQIIE